MGKFQILFIICNLVFVILFSQPALAQTATPSADLKSKLEELKKEIASKVASRAAKLKQEVNRKLKDKAYIGTIKAKSESSITVDTASGPKMVSFNEDTIFENKKGAAVKNKKSFVTIDSITQDEYIAALGDSDETGVLIARKIILLPSPDSEPKSFVWGQVISRSDDSYNIKEKTFKNVTATLPTSPKVNLNDFVIITGSQNDEEIFEAEFAYVVSQAAVIKPKKIATPSAKTASPSAQQSSRTSSTKSR